MTILQLFEMDRPRWTVEAAAKELNFTVSTTYRYFKCLSDAGLICSFSLGEYVLGAAAIEMDRITRHLDPLIQVAKPTMRHITASVNAPFIVLLCRLYRDSVMCVAQDFELVQAFAISYERGRPLPLFRGAASKIILAYLTSKQLERIHKRQHEMMRKAGLGDTLAAIRKNLIPIRKAGLCVTVGELDPGFKGVAAPVFAADGGILGSLGVVMRDGIHAEAVEAAIIAELSAGASEITRRMNLGR